MPKSLDPGSRVVFVLASDADKPKSTQPRFIGRTLTVRQTRELIAAMDGLRNADDAATQIDAATAAMQACITGWENMVDPGTGKPIPFSSEALADVLSLEEMIEIMNALASGRTLTVDEQKKSDSPRSSGAAKSASRARRRVKK